MYAILFVDPKFRLYDIDSAYYFINRSLAQFDSIELKEREKLSKSGVSTEDLINQKEKIEALAFNRAQEINDVSSYQSFLNTYGPSLYIDRVIYLRDKKAFENAQAKDDYKEYLGFMEDYPESSFYQEAQELYELRYFESKTSDQKLVSFVSFLEEHPASFYREEAAKAIYDMLTASNEKEDMENFLLAYDDTQIAKDVINRYFHICSALQLEDDFFLNDRIPQSVKDSIRQLMVLQKQPLVATYQEGKYQLFSKDFKSRLFEDIDSVPPTYLCSEIRSDYLVVENDGTRAVMNRNGEEIYQGYFKEVRDLGLGWLLIEEELGFRLIHKSGISGGRVYPELRLLSGALVMYREGQRWGLKSITDQDLVKAQYDDIYEEGSFIIFVKGSRKGVSNKETILSVLNGNKLKINMVYEDVELINNTFLLCFKGDKETVLNDRLEETIELKRQNIYALKDKWYVKDPDGYTIFEEDFKPTFNLYFEDLLYNDDYLSLKKEGTWSIFHLDSLKPLVLNADSIALLGGNFAQVFSDDSVYLYINDSINMDISAGQNLSYLSTDNNDEFYLLISEAKGKNMVVGSDGKLLFETEFRDITYLGDSLFQVARFNRKGVIDHPIPQPYFCLLLH
jgi:hypothetical protein